LEQTAWSIQNADFSEKANSFAEHFPQYCAIIQNIIQKMKTEYELLKTAQQEYL